MAGISHKTPLKAWQWVMDEAGWENVAEMARKTGLTDDACRTYVYDGRIPPIDKAAQIAQAANIDLMEFARKLQTESLR